MPVVVLGSGGGSGGSSRKYSFAFSSTDSVWTTDSDGNYVIKIPATTHECTENVEVEVYYLNNGLYRKTWGYFTDVSWFVDVDAQGNVTLGSDQKFSGKIVIK